MTYNIGQSEHSNVKRFTTMIQQHVTSLVKSKGPLKEVRISQKLLLGLDWCNCDESLEPGILNLT